MSILEKILSQYGNVVKELPKLKKSYGKKTLEGNVELRIGNYAEYGQEGYHDNKYLKFNVYYDENYKQTKVSLSISNPRMGCGVGVSLSDGDDESKWNMLIRDVKQWSEM